MTIEEFNRKHNLPAYQQNEQFPLWFMEVSNTPGCIAGALIKLEAEKPKYAVMQTHPENGKTTIYTRVAA